MPDHDARWALAAVIIGLFALCLGYAIDTLGGPAASHLIVEAMATPTGQQLVVRDAGLYGPGSYRLFTRQMPGDRLVGATIVAADSRPIGVNPQPSDLAAASAITMVLADGRILTLANGDLIRSWEADRRLALVGFAGAAIALTSGIVAYLLAVEASVGLILLAANALLALLLACMPLALVGNPLGIGILDAGLGILPLIYLLFALRFPCTLLVGRPARAGMAAWLAFTALVGLAHAAAEFGYWLHTPAGAAVRRTRAGLLAVSCVACVAILAGRWWRYRRPNASQAERALARQLSPMLAGFAGSFGTLVIFGILPSTRLPYPGSDLLSPEMGSLATLGIPLGFLAALLPRQTHGFPLVLRRNAVTLLALATTVTVGMLPALAWWARTRSGEPIVAAITALGLLLVAAPPLTAFCGQLQRRLAGQFFRDEYQLPATLRTLGEAVAALESAGAIADYLLPRLGATLDLTWASLEVRSIGDGPSRVHTWGTAQLVALFPRTIPLIAQGEDQGTLTLGPKRRDLPLRREDEALVGILAPLLASALRNARLIAALREERAALAERERALVALGRRATSAAEAERLRLARDLHDVALADLGALRRELDRAGAALPGAAALAGRLTSIGEDVRAIIADLRPPELELGGLTAALRGLVPMAAARLGLELRLDVGACDALRWDPDLELALYRAVQEALANAARHGRASVVAVALHQTGATLTLTVADDGAGLRSAATRPDGEGGLGLLGMRERLAPWGGQITLIASACGGAILTLTVDASPNRASENSASPQPALVTWD